MLENFYYAGGLKLDFLPTAQLETEKLTDKTLDLKRQARNVLRVLMSGWTQDWRELFSYELFQAILVERHHQFTTFARLAFQEGMKHLFTQLEHQTLSTEQQNQAQLFISNCLSYLTFFDPTPHESFAIPQLIEHENGGRWEMIDYKVTPIELTPTHGFEKLFIKEHDRVFAYGLEPINHPKAFPHLLFMGTTYPAGQGFFTTVNTDLEAFETAGKKLYRTGRKNILQWLDTQEKKVHVCGTSLGGALSLLLAIDQGDKLSRVDALNPPGLHPALRKSRYDRWEDFTTKPEVYIQKQGNDPVSIFGVWKEDWHILKVTPPKDKQGPNILTDHALNYAGFEGTTFVGIDTKKDNKEHRSRTFWLYILLRSIVYYILLVPLRYLAVPIVRLTLDNKLHLALLLAFIELFQISSESHFFTASVMSYLISELLQYGVDVIFGTHQSQLSKILEQFEQHFWLQIAISLTTVTISLAILACLVILPELEPILTFIVAIPLSLRIFKSIVNTFRILFGFSGDNIAACHHQELPRERELDIYSKEASATFTYHEIHTYYKAKREILRQKPFIPDANHEHKHRFFKHSTHSKREVLLKSQLTEHQHQTITIKAPLAKIHNMRKTIKLVERFSFERNTELQKTLLEEQAKYDAGNPWNANIL
jgi:hypothetical protein